MRQKNNPFRVPINRSGLTNEEVHRFIENFTDRYSVRLSSGEDLRFVYDYELEAFCEGFKVFELDREYENNAGLVITVRGREEGKITVEYEGELYETFDFWIEAEDGVETMVLSDIMWSADQYNENETNDRGTEEEEKV